MTIHPDWLQPDWRRPGIGAVMTTRAGGCGQGRFESLNLSHRVGDDPVTVDANQARFADAIGATPVWLRQVHATRVARWPSTPDAQVAGSAAVSYQMALPVLFAAPGARAVGAAHAGWRGLAAGVLEATLAAVCEAGRCRPGEVSAWLGACIGPGRFEVGEEVVRAFGAEPRFGSSATGDTAQGGESPRFRPHLPGKWFADLPLLARDRLQAAGVTDVSGGTWCTADDASRFFSFRRDRITGRMAAAIWIEPGR